MTCHCTICQMTRNRGEHIDPIKRGQTVRGRTPCPGCGHMACEGGRCNDCLTCQLSDPRPGGHEAA